MSTQEIKLNNIQSAIDWHCEYNFNEDYHKAVNKLIEKLSKNNKFSMDSGKEDGWVAGLLYVVGEDSDLFNQHNIASDKEYYSKTELAEGCGVSVSTMKSRAQKIREALPLNSVFKADISNFNDSLENNMLNDIQREYGQTIRQELCKLLGSNKINFEDLSHDSHEKYKEYQYKAINSCDYKEAVKYMKKAIAEAKKKINSNTFKDLKGQLWLEHDARPYMNLKQELSNLYCLGGEYDNSIKELWDLIKLNRLDDQGNRFDLATLLLQEKRFTDFEKLIDMFADDKSIFMIYSRALYAYKKGDILSAKRYIKEAFELNEYVPLIFMGLAQLIESQGDSYSVGSQEEATLYFIYSIDAWKTLDKALFWLVDEYYTYKEKEGINVALKKEIVKKYIEEKYFQG